MTQYAKIAAIMAGAAGIFYALRAVFQTPTVEVQAVWTTAGVLGTVVTVLNLRDALHDRAALSESGRNGNLAFMANESIRLEVIRLSKMITVIVIGVVVLVSAPVLTAHQRAILHIPEWTPQSVIITAGLMWIVIGTVAQSLLDRRLRLRFYLDEPHSPKVGESP